MFREKRALALRLVTLGSNGMARLRLYHESLTPRLKTLEPRVPAVDDGESAGGMTWKTTGEGNDKRPAVWLSKAPDDATPYTLPRVPFRYAVEIDDADANFVIYNKEVPGWFRYLAPLPVVAFLVLDRGRDSFVTVESLKRQYKGLAEALNAAHGDYQDAVEAALDEPDPAKKGALHVAAAASKQRLFDAAEATDAAYRRLAQAIEDSP
jgi:hypothetical protein